MVLGAPLHLPSPSVHEKKVFHPFRHFSAWGISNPPAASFNRPRNGNMTEDGIRYGNSEILKYNEGRLPDITTSPPTPEERKTS